MKKYFIFLFLILVSLLSACKSENYAFYEVEKLTKTNYKEVLGSANKDLEVDELFTNAVINFSYQTAADLLEERNGMISPLSFYIALSELAEITGENSQAEILNVLGINDLNILRNGNKNLYQKLCYENKISTLKIANSIWLNKHFEYKDPPLLQLRDYYYASSYGVDFTNSVDKKQIGKWVSDNTGGKLGEGDFDDLDELTVFVLLNTIYFYDEWLSKFDKDNNVMDSFYGVDQNVKYMHQKLDGKYYGNDEYKASSLEFKNGLRIVFAMPNDSSKFSSFINDPKKIESALNNNKFQNSEVLYYIPKFEYKSSFDLIPYANKLGIVSVFDENISNFKVLSDLRIFVSAMYQKTFIQIDEAGGKAGAYTGIVGETESMPNYATFKLNKPFVYAIYSGDYPIFIGSVINPNSNIEEEYS